MRSLLPFVIATLAFAAHAQTLYRCDDGRGGVLYADQPCAGGRVVDVPPHRTDPHARERLDRELREFEARHAAREAALRREREAERQERLARAKAAEEQPEPAAQPWSYYTPYYGYGWPARPVRPPRPMPAPRSVPGYLPVR